MVGSVKQPDRLQQNYRYLNVWQDYRRQGNRWYVSIKGRRSENKLEREALHVALTVLTHYVCVFSSIFEGEAGTG